MGLRLGLGLGLGLERERERRCGLGLGLGLMRGALRLLELNEERWHLVGEITAG